ncbi:MAG: J domain-containing protein [Anaerolineae bacterium]|nr:J domain-containing protein [Anaerolineae bacterium]
MFETVQEQLTRLRVELEQAQTSLFEAEADLADHLAEVYAFETVVEEQLGPWLDKLVEIEKSLEYYQEQMERLRNEQRLGSSLPGVERQYKRVWDVPPPRAPKPPPEPPSPATEAQVKKLYRQLARRFHPDLAADEADRLYRTEMMAAINNAYAARSLVELLAMEKQTGDMPIRGRKPTSQTDAQLIQVLQEEQRRIHRRLREIEQEKRAIPNRPSIRLSLEVKLAQRQGRDLLAEMAADLEKKVARKEVERDFLKSQFDQLGWGGPIIKRK